MISNKLVMSQIFNLFYVVLHKPIGWNTIFDLAEDGNLNSLKIFVEKTEVPNLPNAVGHTPIDIAKFNNNFEVCSFLEEYCNTKWMPLFEAAWTGNIDCMKMKIKDGAFFDEKSSRTGSTALMMAIENGKFEVVQYLISLGADPNTCRNDRITPIHLAERNGFPDICKYLIENSAKINTKGPKTRSRYLIENSAKINTEGPKTRSRSRK